MLRHTVATKGDHERAVKPQGKGEDQLSNFPYESYAIIIALPESKDPSGADAYTSVVHCRYCVEPLIVRARCYDLRDG
jgi:hypothetical protein